MMENLVDTSLLADHTPLDIAGRRADFNEMRMDPPEVAVHGRDGTQVGSAHSGSGPTGHVAFSSKMKTVYTVVERSSGRAFWVKIGVGFVNRDGSLNLRLDAVPVNGSLQVRDYEPSDGVERARPLASGRPDVAQAPLDPPAGPVTRPRKEGDKSGAVPDLVC